MDWHGAKLSLETVITKDFRLTQNVRRFFNEFVGSEVHFTHKQIQELKNSTGKTLREMCGELFAGKGEHQ